MIVLEILLAVAFTKWGGRLADFDDGLTCFVGWLFMFAGLGVAVAIGAHL